MIYFDRKQLSNKFYPKFCKCSPVSSKGYSYSWHNKIHDYRKDHTVERFPKFPRFPAFFWGREIPTCDSEFCEGTPGTMGTGGNISYLMKFLLPQGYNTCYYGDVTFATTRGSKIASSNESENSSAMRSSIALSLHTCGNRLAWERKT